MFLRHGSFTIFLLLNDMSHDAHFSTRQNMEPEDFLEKKLNFSLHGFFRYLTSNMALQKIILTSFFFVFVFFFFSAFFLIGKKTLMLSPCPSVRPSVRL